MKKRKNFLLQVKYDLNLIQGHYPGERLKPDKKSLQLIEVNNLFHVTRVRYTYVFTQPLPLIDTSALVAPTQFCCFLVC